MNPIVKILSDYLDENPEIRFGQALFNLNINAFIDLNVPPGNAIGRSALASELRDPYNDSDIIILERIQKQKDKPSI